jgi:hypothetical protein
MNTDSDNRNDDILDRTCEFWGRRFGRHVTRDEGEQIAVHVVGFFTTLGQWLLSEIESPANDNDQDMTPDDEGCAVTTDLSTQTSSGSLTCLSPVTNVDAFMSEEASHG